jgi:hypothetical protein
VRNMVGEESRWLLPLIILGFLFGILILYVFYTITVTNTTNVLPLFLVIGTILLIITLTFAAWVFKSLNIADPCHALALPEGSMQAVIALSLILIFMMLSIYLYQDVSYKETLQVVNLNGISKQQLDQIPANDLHSVTSFITNNETRYNVSRLSPTSATADDIAKQVITTVSTLVVAVAGFYFGSKAVSTHRGESPISAPVIQTIKPTSGARGNVVKFEITGMGLESAREIKLIHDKVEIPCTGILSRSDLVTCTFSIPTDDNEYPIGKYTVVVTNSDKGQGKLENAFEIK